MYKVDITGAVLNRIFI